MKTTVALLRGINVGGKHSLPMQDLRRLLGELACADVKTYIQSGNAVFNTAANLTTLSGDISKRIEQQFGFAPSVLVLGIDAYRSIIAANPFPNAVSEPRSIHIHQLIIRPASGLQAVRCLLCLSA